MRIAAALLLLLGCSQEASPPKLIVEQTALDFGTLSQGGYAVLSIPLKNEGSSPLEIEDVHLDCSCLKVELPSRQISAHESVAMKVTFLAGRLSGMVKEAFVVRTSAGEATVKVSANVQPYFLFEPASLDFGEVAGGDTVTRDVTMKDAKGRPFKIQEAGVDNSMCSLVWEPCGEAGWTAHVTLKATGISRLISTLLHITTDRPGIQRRQDYIIQGEIISPLQAVPKVVNFGYSEKGSFPAANVKLINRGSKPVEIERVVVHGTEAVECAWSGLEVTLTPKKGLAAGRFSGELLVYAKGMDGPLVVPITGQVRKE